jgi:hypothetical protein
MPKLLNPNIHVTQADVPKIHGHTPKFTYSLRDDKHFTRVRLERGKYFIFRYQAPDEYEYYWIPLNEMTKPDYVPVVDETGKRVALYNVLEGLDEEGGDDL